MTSGILLSLSCLGKENVPHLHQGTGLQSCTTLLYTYSLNKHAKLKAFTKPPFLYFQLTILSS